MAKKEDKNSGAIHSTSMYPGIADYSGDKNGLYLDLHSIAKDTTRTPIIVGRAGGGKTSLVNDYANYRNEFARKYEGKEKYFDEVIMLRLQGVMPEDFKGIPRIIQKPDGSEGVEFLKFGELEKMISNPDKKYLVFLDEINRANSNLLPVLMPFLRHKIETNGKVHTLDNVQIIGAANLGDNYQTNIDFNEDGAIQRSIVWMSYESSKEECIDFMREKEYDPLIIEIAERMDSITKYTNIKSEKFEQSMNLGSWYEFNNIIKNMRSESKNGKISMEDIIFTFENFIGNCYFDNTEKNGNSKDKIFNILTEIKNNPYHNRLNPKENLKVSLTESLKLSFETKGRKKITEGRLLSVSNNVMPKVHREEALNYLNLTKGTRTTPILVGLQGTGKTHAIQEFYERNREKYDKMLELDFRGVEDIDLKGIPRVKKDGKWIEFVKLGALEEIKSNPDKKYLLLLDEIDRAPENLMPMLFQLLTKELDGLPMSNVDIIGAMNHGEGFDTSIDFTSDSALLRRCTFLEIIPTKQEVIDYINEQDYHPIVLNVMTEMVSKNKIFDFNSDGNSQKTHFGSWKTWNDTIKEKENIYKLMGKTFSTDEILDSFISRHGDLLFSPDVANLITFRLNEIKNKKDLSNIDYIEEILKPGKIPDEIINSGISESEVLMVMSMKFAEALKATKEINDKGNHTAKTKIVNPEQFEKLANVFSVSDYAFAKNLLSFIKVEYNDKIANSLEPKDRLLKNFKEVFKGENGERFYNILLKAGSLYSQALKEDPIKQEQFKQITEINKTPKLTESDRRSKIEAVAKAIPEPKYISNIASFVKVFSSKETVKVNAEGNVTSSYLTITEKVPYNMEKKLKLEKENEKFITSLKEPTMANYVEVLKDGVCSSKEVDKYVDMFLDKLETIIENNFKVKGDGDKELSLLVREVEKFDRPYAKNLVELYKEKTENIAIMFESIAAICNKHSGISTVIAYIRDMKENAIWKTYIEENGTILNREKETK